MACAGSGVRMGADADKLLLRLHERPVVAWSVEALDACPLIDMLVVVASEHNLQRIAEIVEGMATRLPLELVIGGARRQDSVGRAVDALAGHAVDMVVVHDGARPLVSPALLERVIAAASEHGAATAALALKNACKEVDDRGFVVRSIERSSLVSVQTPQAFVYDILARAHQEGRAQGAVVDDDAELVERLGMSVKVVPGEHRNIKITTPDDLPILEAHLAATPR
ncbi:MAG: 2-C-methyl-D-erythritol 4-phosphate cytidylyltransferase [Candidatus Dormiibacterota bacterium]